MVVFGKPPIIISRKNIEIITKMLSEKSRSLGSIFVEKRLTIMATKDPQIAKNSE